MPALPPPWLADEITVAPSALAGWLDFATVFRWSATERPVEIEVGFGKGRALVETAACHPERDFLGVEQARALVRRVHGRVLRAGLLNVRLVHGSAREVLAQLVPDASVVRVRVDFPDPWPKRRHAKHRLFAGAVPDVLARILRPGGDVLLSTDHDSFHRDAARRLGAHAAFIRTTMDEAFRGLPRGGFEAIFRSQAVPVLRSRWERTRDDRRPDAPR